MALNLPYEWSVREDAALKAGLEPAVINDALRKNGVLGSDEGEFTRVRRATETLFNLVLEARP